MDDDDEYEKVGGFLAVVVFRRRQRIITARPAVRMVVVDGKLMLAASPSGPPAADSIHFVLGRAAVPVGHGRAMITSEQAKSVRLH